MKYIDFLTNLEAEIKDANNGIGKTPASVQSYCDTINGVFKSIEDKMDSIINDDSYKISDIHIDAENENIFNSIIRDLLNKEIIMHKEDYFLMKYPESVESKAIKESRSMMATTRTIREMMSGKNMVMVDKRGFRKYVNRASKIMASIGITKVKDVGKYDETNEDIFLKTLGITIKGDYILKGEKKEKINVTDKTLIYYLYYKSFTNPDECFSIKDLSSSTEIDKSEKYISNRISYINKKIRQIISKSVKIKIGKFIIKEKSRGYHLNPKILTKNQLK